MTETDQMPPADSANFQEVGGTDDGSTPEGENRRSTRRGRIELGLTVLLSAAAGAVILFACSRQWWGERTVRPMPLPPLMKTVHGRDVAPWSAGMGFVGLSGAAALLATRRNGRAVIGSLLLLAGITVIGGGVLGFTSDLPTDAARVDYAPAWPVLTIVFGALLAAAGAWTVLRFRHWRSNRAGMGSRYEAPSTARLRASGATDPATLWDSLDRGIDPTTETGPKTGGDNGVK